MLPWGLYIVHDIVAGVMVNDLVVEERNCTQVNTWMAQYNMVSVSVGDKVAIMMVYHVELDSKAASKVEVFLVLGESYMVTTVGSAMVEAAWEQCGEGHAVQVDDEGLLLLPSPDVAYAVLEARGFCSWSLGWSILGCNKCAVRHGSTLIGGRKKARATVIGGDSASWAGLSVMAK